MAGDGDLVQDASVLVTAGAGGAGRVIAQGFADRGAHVAVCDVNAEAVAAVNAGTAAIKAYHADVSDEVAVDQIFADLETSGRPVDVVVNNVGIAGPTAGIEDITLADWQRSLDVNLTSFFLTIRRATPGMKQRGRGAIVNISSASVKTGLPMRLPYIVTKGAVVHMTTNLARELGPDGIRVNAILPGAIRGDRINTIIQQKAAAMNRTAADYEAELLQYTSLRTMVEPEDIANMAVYLASAQGARMSGQCIGVDGNAEYEV
ncbi:MAG: SDR family oxidoreductase [Pseudomonadota bacterium]